MRLEAAFISDILYLSGQGNFFGKLGKVFKSCACDNHVTHVVNSLNIWRNEKVSLSPYSLLTNSNSN